LPAVEKKWKGILPGDLRVVFHRLQKKSITAYVVGPAVRDALASGSMDKVQRLDIIAVTPSLQDVEQTLGSASATNLFVSKPERLRRSAVTFHITDNESGRTIRRLVVTSVPSVSGLEEELMKREVTVNAIAMTADGGIVDPFDGASDLALKQVRPILKPSTIFSHKPLFLVKIAKHVAYHGFTVEDETELSAARYALNILDVPMERIRPELERMLVNLHPDLGLDFLQRVGVLKYVLPELQSLVGFDESCPVHHKDIWAHTKKVVCRSKPTPAIRWAALLHDIGKVWTRSIDDDGRVHFFRHEELGALLFRGIGARLGLEDRLMGKVHYLIENHSRINMYTAEWTDSAVRRLVREVGDELDDLLCLSRADITSRHERRVEELTSQLDNLSRRVAEVKEEDAREPILPKGAGLVIMQHFGLPEGPIVGALKDELESALEEGRLPAGRPVEEYMGHLQEFIRKEGGK
jgi:poly(A) polymerase